MMLDMILRHMPTNTTSEAPTQKIKQYSWEEAELTKSEKDSVLRITQKWFKKFL